MVRHALELQPWTLTSFDPRFRAGSLLDCHKGCSKQTRSLGILWLVERSKILLICWVADAILNLGTSKRAN